MEKFTDWHLYADNDVLFREKVWEFHGVVRDWAYLYNVEQMAPTGCPISECRFILRRLESMTREENEKYDKWLDFSDYTSGGTFELKKNMVHSSMFVDENNAYIDVYFVAQMINELRKDGFDCDHLIESRQAIDQATLNQNARKQNPKEDHSGRQEEGISGIEDNQVQPDRVQ